VIHAYHPPGAALASIPVLLHPGHWFSLLVVLPFIAAAAGSAAAMSKWLSAWPVYPKSLRDCAGVDDDQVEMHLWKAIHHAYTRKKSQFNTDTAPVLSKELPQWA
jgi:hypothetical protein